MKRTELKRSTTPIPKVTPKLRANQVKYSGMRPAWFEDHPDCELRCCPECRGVATDVHHLEGREGELLLDSSKWRSACRPCHDWVKGNSKKAMELGLILPRNTSIR